MSDRGHCPNVGGETIDAEVAVRKVRPGQCPRRRCGRLHLASGKSTRTGSGILFVSYASAWLIYKPGLQIYWAIPDMDEP